MSTHFNPEWAVQWWAERCGLVLEELLPKEAPYQPEWRLKRGTQIVFQGSMDRCSDFVRGFAMGAGHDVR